jgi:Ca-activated chloride channel family protein
MKEPDGTGSSRMESAKGALREIVTALPESLDVGLRVYGHRVPSADKAAACQDTELAVPVAPLDRGLLLGTIERLQPLGETPIGLSLQQAAGDLPDGVPGTVILVSDGEDECFPDLGPEPCAVTRDLIAQGVDLRLETIGLQVEPAGAEQLRCMAEAGGGEFTSVQDAGLLAEAIAGARNRSLRTFEPRGEAVAGGPSLIDATVLSPGTYRDSIVDGETLWFAVDLAKGASMTARLTIRTADVPTDARVALEWQDPQARRVQVGVLAGLSRGQASTVAADTGPADGSRSPFGAQREPGRFYLAVRTGGFPSEVEHDFVLELLPEGLPVPEPGASGDASGDPLPASSEPTANAPRETTEPSEAAPAPAAPAVAPPPPPPSTSPCPWCCSCCWPEPAGAATCGGVDAARRRTGRRSPVTPEPGRRGPTPRAPGRATRPRRPSAPARRAASRARPGCRAPR